MSKEDNPPNPLSWSDDRLLTRKEASAYAAALGIPLAVNTLAKLKCRGGGPPITRYDGRKPLYRLSALRAWLHARLSDDDSKH